MDGGQHDERVVRAEDKRGGAQCRERAVQGGWRDAEHLGEWADSWLEEQGECFERL